ncbi:hypothetical protein BO85DRAFT_253669 [Aspergillus piperis CBS 112811]|uniref:Uncharacterized protein n=1 Tax=Aspergillus piperis CBS 112811 TaxID=1448313 RepID=A0A8G1R5G9_9EURO|nr:hypothetical protein BO85DRAFT_253669 [Aspergillus piperis CBS 112811]RAH59923.1 hypothetical protein BO85DRAFT_253669 [Aspergillus piperis CBS 112811]
MAKASLLRSHDAANGTNHGLFIFSLIFLFRRHLKAWSCQSRVDPPGFVIVSCQHAFLADNVIDNCFSESAWLQNIL